MLVVGKPMLPVMKVVTPGPDVHSIHGTSHTALLTCCLLHFDRNTQFPSGQNSPVCL